MKIRSFNFFIELALLLLFNVFVLADTFVTLLLDDGCDALFAGLTADWLFNFFSYFCYVSIFNGSIL